jgi:hypothetical protein
LRPSFLPAALDRPGERTNLIEMQKRWAMAKVHEYLLILPNGKYEITKSNGPICFQQSRQEVGGHFETFNPQLGNGFTAQINEGGSRLNLPANGVFKNVAGNVLIGRTHGAEMWGLTPGQREEILVRLNLTRSERP